MSKVSITIIGLNGFLGKPVLEAINSGIFDDKINFPIKAITRKEPETKNDKIEYVVSEINEESIKSTLSQKLSGTDVIIELIGPNPEAFANIENLVDAIKPKLFIPSQFGTDIPKVDEYAPGFLGIKTQHSENVRKLGVKVVDIITSLFAVPGAFLYEWVGSTGINADDKTVKLIGDINQQFDISKLEDVGKAVLSIATNPNPRELPDTIRIGSDRITVKDVIDRYSKDHNVELKVVSEQSAEDAKKEFTESLKAGFDGEKFLWYLQVIAAQGLDKGLLSSKLDNELVNPGESLWKWGKY
ncbi:putative oxidoreductase [Candida albicans SC5314]|nr:putative oxidoreductase [Candida albicans SC5314]